ncbi:hypothetical protein D3C72_2469960 [compost metagenome]
MLERKLERHWVEEAVRRPAWREPDMGDPAILRCFKSIPERANRYLRVVCVETDDEIRIISAFLDRSARPR